MVLSWCVWWVDVVFECIDSVMRFHMYETFWGPKNRCFVNILITLQLGTKNYPTWLEYSLFRGNISITRQLWCLESSDLAWTCSVVSPSAYITFVMKIHAWVIFLSVLAHQSPIVSLGIRQQQHHPRVVLGWFGSELAFVSLGGFYMDRLLRISIGTVCMLSYKKISSAHTLEVWINISHSWIWRSYEWLQCLDRKDKSVV